ncbi:MBG domain-containing protein [Luteolibacter sp. GHJ8]|uniref:MBG domain-containing protein n=1 Tax=Luteolibacter rhizosphaerae TaxID=2989719 RepID=A0ABT3GAG0_9BACT|nr:MBG domain-containing protein [Luteolibacter rhizosphaerae]MCW1916827.1 MBG domain-containing protein [Luteolibacter rhizosphaerae]
MLFALLMGALVGVVSQQPESAAEGRGPEKVSKREAPRMAGVEAADEAMPVATAESRDDFQRLPRAGRKTTPEASPLPSGPLSPEEVKARKIEALEGILATINTFPGLKEERRESLARYAAQLANSDTPRIQCWAPDTAPETVYAYQKVEQQIAAAGGMSVKALQIADRWNRTATNGTGQGTQGQPVTLRWSIVPDGTPIPSTESGESSDASSLRARMTAIYGGSATGDPAAQPWFPVFQAVFDNLAAVSGLRFVYEPNDDGVTIDGITNGSDWGVTGTRGDIRISGHSIDGNSNVLAYAYYPDNGDVVVDTNDSFFADISNNSIRLRNVMEHEIGHALGLDHVCPINQTKLMEPFISTAYRGSQFDDVYSFQRNYGDPLEVHGTLRNNDSTANARALTLVAGTTSSWEWLSIDDNTDSDHYSFSANTAQQVTVRIIPSDPIQPANPNTDTYLEGSQNSDGSCSAGTAFDPTTQQDLILDLLASNGTTVSTTAVSRPAGETEEITNFQIPTNGTHYIRVRGGSADRAQLYRMEVLLVNAIPSPVVSASATRLDAESNSGLNGAADPSETVRLGITLVNNGTLSANSLNATLTGPSGTTIFDGSESYGTLATGASAERLFVFALSGAASQQVNLSLALNASGYSETLTIPVTLGEMNTSAPLNQNFDGGTALPSGWTRSVSGAGSQWVISSNFSSSAPNSAFSPSVATPGEAILTSPTVTIGPLGGTLEFQHRYNLEDGYDGGVLEASQNGGAWFDLMNSAATVEDGDYNRTIATGFSSSIAGREAWSSDSGSFVPTRIVIPAAWGGSTMAFRWRLVHDSSVGQSGWNVDSVILSSEVPTADPFKPFVSLSASGTSLSESSSTPVNLTLTTPLPLVQSVSVALNVSGTASAADVNGLNTLVLPAGQTSTSLGITASADGLVEGAETLNLAIPSGAAGFAAAAPSSVSISIADTEIQSATVTLSNLSVTYDGTPKSATVTTNPAGLATTVTYNGSAQLPVNAGTYAMQATVTSPGYTGSASGSFVIVSAYRAWIAGFSNPDAPAAAAGADLDQDGWDNASEYALGTSPLSGTSVPQLVPVLTATKMQLLLPAAPVGINRSVETSTDLDSWGTAGVTAIPGGYEVTRSLGRRFLRVVYEVVN